MDKVVYHMPFAKVDQERRIVSGFATLNNLDKQDDIVTTEASVKAFSAWRGNIREQHTKIAAGKMLSFGVEQFFDQVSKKVYDGIFVRAYISKGAPETWEKVIDGTLSGFSIGGEIKEFETKTDDAGNVYREITDYELAELSLVDNPANPLANVLSVEKAHDFFADIADTIEEKESNNMARVTKSEEAVEAVAEVVDEPVVEEAVVDAPVEEVAEEAAEVAEVAEIADAPKDEQADETSSKSEENVEPEADSHSDADILAEAINGINSLIEENNNKAAEAFTAIVEQLKEMQASVAGASSQIEEVKGELAGVKSTVSEFDKRVQSVEADTAVRKSGDLGEVNQETNKTQKSVWGGAFLTADL